MGTAWMRIRSETELQVKVKTLQEDQLCTAKDDSRDSDDVSSCMPYKTPRHVLWTAHKSNLLLKWNNSFNEQDPLLSCDFECWRCAFKRNRDRECDRQPLPVVPEVPYSVDAGLCAMRNVPLNGHVALTKQSFGPVKPSRQTKNCSQQENPLFICFNIPRALSVEWDECTPVSVFSPFLIHLGYQIRNQQANPKPVRAEKHPETWKNKSMVIFVDE